MRRSSTRSSDAASVALAALLAAGAAFHPVDAAEHAPGDRGEPTVVEIRLARAKDALAAGGREVALGEYRELGEFYRRGGDRLSASVADLEAGRVLVDLDRYDEAARLLAASRNDDPDADRKAERDHLLAVALERGGRPDEARAALVVSRRSLPESAYDRYVREDAQRLGVDARPRRWGSVAWGLVAIAMWFVLAGALWRTRRAEIAMAAGTFFAAVGLAEVALRAMMPAATDVRHLLHPPSRSTVFHPERGVMPGVDYAESRFTTNAAGLRGGALPGRGVMRVLAIGGSTTEALYLDDRDAWPAVLEADLARRTGASVWVGNAGKSGLTSFAHVSQVRVYADEIKPAVVVVQAGINDLSLCISGGRRELRENAARFRYPDAWDAYGRGVFAEVRPPGAGRGLRLQQLVDRAFPAARTRDAAKDAERGAVVQDDAATYYHVLRARRAAAEKVGVAPDIDECLAAFEANLRRIAALAQSSGAKLVLVTQGALYRVPMPEADEKLLWFGSVDRSVFGFPAATRYYTSAVLADGLARYNAVTLKVCAELKLACVDADAVLARDTGSYYDDVHMNVAGARRLGEAIAAAIAPVAKP